MPQLKKLTEEDLKKIVLLSPAEQADSDAFEARNPHFDQLDQAIAKAPTPQAKADLIAERDSRMAVANAGPKLQHIDPSMFQVSHVDPSKFVLATPPNALDPTDGMSTTDKVLAGVGSGMMNLYRGTKQTGLSALDYATSHIGRSPEFAKTITDARAANQGAIDEANKLDKPLLATGAGATGNIIGQVAPSLVIPMGGVGATTTLRAIASGLGQGAANAAITSRPSDENAAKFWGLNTALGGVGGGIMHGGGTLVNAIRNKFRDFPSTIGNQATPVEAYQAAKAADIPVNIGDIAPTSWWRGMENMLQRVVPFSGRQGSMEAQAQAVSDAAKTFQAAHGADAVTQGKDPARALFDSIQKEYQTRLAGVKSQFDKVGDLASKNDALVQTPVTTNAVKSVVSNYGPELFQKTEDPRLVASMDRIVNGTDPLSFTDMRNLRTLVGAKIRGNSRGKLSDDEAGALKQIYAGINNDLDAWGKASTQNADIVDAYKAASDAYKQKIDPYKQDPLLNKVRKADPETAFDYDKVLRAAVRDNSPARASIILDQAGPDGRRIAGGHVIDQAVDAGLDPNIPGSLSTERLLAGLDIGRSRGAVFDPAVTSGGLQVGGQAVPSLGNFETALRAADRAEDYAKGRGGRAATGAAAVGLPAVASSLHIPLTAVALGTAAGMTGGGRLANAITNSDIGKRMYLADPTAFSSVAQGATRALPASWEDLIQQLYGQ